jgi:hypothetical protein
MKRFLAVILALCFAFMAIVDVKVASDGGSIRWGVYVGYLIGTVLLAYLAVRLWRRPRSA